MEGGATSRQKVLAAAAVGALLVVPETVAILRVVRVAMHGAELTGRQRPAAAQYTETRDALTETAIQAWYKPRDHGLYQHGRVVRLQLGTVQARVSRNHRWLGPVFRVSDARLVPASKSVVAAG